MNWLTFLAAAFVFCLRETSVSESKTCHTVFFKFLLLLELIFVRHDLMSLSLGPDLADIDSFITFLCSLLRVLA